MLDESVKKCGLGSLAEMALVTRSFEVIPFWETVLLGDSRAQVHTAWGVEELP